MRGIATLGPEGTFAELAAGMYAGRPQGVGHPIVLCPSIREVFLAVGSRCTYGVVPIENMVEGYVQPTLDLLLHSPVTIVGELLLPVRFSFVANCSDLNDVARVYVQFVTQGQCSDFLENLGDTSIITTPSNGVSAAEVLLGEKGEGAVVPTHTVGGVEPFSIFIENVNDFDNNVTRFIVLAAEGTRYEPGPGYKTSIVVVRVPDKPGTLHDILGVFHKHEINLTSIISRPTKEQIGRYHFFIDIEGHEQESPVREALEEIAATSHVKHLGSYPVLEESPA